MNELTNELDKIKTGIPKEHWCCKNNIPAFGEVIGARYNIDYNGMLKISISGKLFRSPCYLGLINKENFKTMPKKLFNEFGIEVDEKYLFNRAELYEIHVTRDLPMKQNPSFYISDLRQIFKRNTDKFDVQRFIGIRYEHGLVVMPKTQNNYRLTIYNKGVEVALAKNKEYRSIFDYEYLEKLNKILRIEYQLRKFKDIRESFDIDYVGSPAINDIFSSDTDVIAKLFEKLDIKGVKDEI